MTLTGSQWKQASRTCSTNATLQLQTYRACLLGLPLSCHVPPAEDIPEGGLHHAAVLDRYGTAANVLAMASPSHDCMFRMATLNGLQMAAMSGPYSTRYLGNRLMSGPTKLVILLDDVCFDHGPQK